MKNLKSPRPTPDPVRDCVFAVRDSGLLLQEIRKSWNDEALHMPQKAGRVFASPIGAKTRRTHYKPLRHARLVLELEFSESEFANKLKPQREYASLQIYSSRLEAESRFQSLKEGSTPLTQGPPLLFLPEFHAVMTLLPNSPRLSKVKHLLRPRKLQKLLQKHGIPCHQDSSACRDALELIRFVPRKRAVFRYSFHGESLYLKIFTKEDHKVAAEDLQRISQLQRDHRFAFQVPQLIAYDPDVHVIFMNEIAGDQVTKSYSFRDSNLWERCGYGLATLHKLKAIEDLPEWTVKDEFRAIEKGSHELILAIPGVEAVVESLLESLRQRLPEMERYSPRAIHANLFGDQMLDDGEKLGIVDWEDLCLGDPCFDMGRLGAHILSCAVTTKFPLDHAQRALVCIESAHRDALNDDFLQPHRFAWHLIGALLLRAKIRSLRQLPKHWEAEIVALVNMAAEIREGSLGPWRLPSRR